MKIPLKVTVDRKQFEPTQLMFILAFSDSTLYSCVNEVVIELYMCVASVLQRYACCRAI